MKKNTVIVVVSNIVLGVILLAVGGTIARKFVADSQTPDRAPPEFEGELVDTTPLGSSVHEIEVEAQGEVVPAREWALQSQVTGRVEFMHPNLRRGGFVAEGDLLIEVDRSQYRTLLEARRAQVDQAEASIDIEEGLGELAEREWQLFSDRFDASGDASLALREPQMRSAEANLDAAEANEELAEIDLSRTRIYAPFNAYVRDEQLEPEMLVSPGMNLAMLVATDHVWVEVSIPIERLDWIEIPGVSGTSGSLATVSMSNADRTFDGRVLELLGDLDPTGRMARLLIQVDDPWNLAAPETERGTPLFLNAYVDVAMTSSRQIRGYEVPREGLRNGEEVWIYSDGALDIRTVDPVWRFEDSVLVTEGLDEGDQLIVSRIGIPIDGMALRVLGDEDGTGGAEGNPEAAELGDE